MSERGEGRKSPRLGRVVPGRPSHSTVVAYLALFVALGGTGAWAADKITSKQIAKNAVRSKHVKNGQVKAVDLGKAAVTAAKLACKGNSAQDKMIRAGAVCIDKYEVSVWTKRTGGQRIIGTIPCSLSGQDCKGKIFARSVKGVPPRTNITWFQAAQALANSGKRLPSNAEWQQAAAGTPDGPPCNVSSGAVQNAGQNAGCVSGNGANDMVGNLWEWVADWVPASTACPGWGPFSDDQMCLSGASTTVQGPNALVRGGGFFDGAGGAGPFAVGRERPSLAIPDVGFRGAR